MRTVTRALLGSTPFDQPPELLGRNVLRVAIGVDNAIVVGLRVVRLYCPGKDRCPDTLYVELVLEGGAVWNELELRRRLAHGT